MAQVAIITAVYGNYDHVRQQAEQDIDVDWICVTDTPAEVPAPWNVLEQPARFDDPCMAAKVPKMLPWEVTDHRHVLWVDANMQVTSPAFAREALAQRQDGIAVHAHPRRDCIYTEAEASIGAEAQGGKYAQQPIVEQVAHYRTEGHPAHDGLYACGTIAWDTGAPAARALGAGWLAECRRWSFQDQLSLPVVRRRLGLHPGVFSHPQLERRFRGPGHLGNRWLQIHPHQ